jgi:ATP-binding cassette subfamily C protein
VLDEATSALDPEAEATVIETIRRLRGTVTVVAVAHRLWSIRDADEIIVIEHGRIVQRGGFRDLATRPGRFCDLLTLQSADTSHSTAQPQEFT